MIRKSYKSAASRRSLFVIALIGIGFLWSGMAYMIQAFRLMHFIDGMTVNLIVCGLYYVLQAIGIAAIAILFMKKTGIAGGRILPFYTSIAMLICTGLAVFSEHATIIMIAGILLNLLIGILSGCYLTRIATDIPQQQRGIVFGTAYAFGSIGTWLVSLPMGGRFLWHSKSFFAVIIIAAISLVILQRMEPITGQGYEHVPVRVRYDKQLVWLAGGVLILYYIVSMLGFAFPLKSAEGFVNIEFTRAFYAIGLIIAGLASDKNRRWGAICCLAALAFPFAALALGKTAAGQTTMWMLAYLFLGFGSVYRILVFADISGKTKLPALAVLGLMAGRMGEAAGTVGATYLQGTALVAVAGTVFMLVIALFFSLYQKLYTYAISPEEAERKHLNTYGASYQLSPRELEIFSLIIQGFSNAEIATALYITESTVKFHTGNIFKKTGCSNRSELTADYRLGVF